MARVAHNTRHHFYLAIRLSDILAIIFSGLICFMLKFQTIDLYELPLPYLTVIFIEALLVVIVFPGSGIYQSWRGKPLSAQFYLLLKVWLIISMTLIAFGFLTKTSSTFSRQWVLSWLLLNLFFLIATRLILNKILAAYRTRGIHLERVALVGSSDMAIKIQNRINESHGIGFQIVALVTEEHIKNSTLEMEVIKGGKQIASICHNLKIDEVWMLLPMEKINEFKTIYQALAKTTIDIRFIPELHDLPMFNYPSAQLLGFNAWNVSISPITGGNRIAKALEDTIFSLFFLILLSPLFILISLGVKLSSPGPVFYRQKRHGWDGKIIKVYKFRSMLVHHEENGTVTQAKKNDSRITTFGAFLRKTNLDEIPQFFNVLQGRMSITGPRPHAVAHNEYYMELIEDYMKRHKVKPGITGWAQVNGWRGETETLDKMKSRVEYDLYYINNWSLWFDLKIIMLTILRCFFNKNAY